MPQLAKEAKPIIFPVENVSPIEVEEEENKEAAVVLEDDEP
jgi:hypothetical protein